MSKDRTDTNSLVFLTHNGSASRTFSLRHVQQIIHISVVPAHSIATSWRAAYVSVTTFL